MLMFLVIGFSLVLLLAGIAIETERHRQEKTDKALSALSKEDRRLLEVSRTNDYRKATMILKQLRLIDETGGARLKGNIWDFNLEYLAEALGNFWRLRWPNLPPALYNKEISRAAHNLVLEFNEDQQRLEEDIIAVIRQRHSDVARLLKAEIFKQFKEAE